jgi:hypothetical protein
MCSILHLTPQRLKEIGNQERRRHELKRVKTRDGVPVRGKVKGDLPPKEPLEPRSDL